jgi:hypothetical protein
MRPRIPEITRNMVIEMWLQGASRNIIAQECGLGKGTVSAIIEEWSRSTGKDIAIQLRDFSLALHKSGLSLSDCVRGYRLALTSKKLGINIDEPEHFLEEIYTACLSEGLEPRYVAELLEDLISISSGLNSISAMFERLRAMNDEKENLSNSMKCLKEEIDCLHAERAAAEELRDCALENERITQANLDSYIKTREELRKFGIPVDDISKFSKAVKWLSKAGYDPTEVVSTYSDYHTLKYATCNLQRNLDKLENDISGLEEKKASLERSIDLHTHTISQVEELARVGIDMKQLMRIRFIVTEIAKANSVDHNLAWKKFYKDLGQYDAKLGFEREIQAQRVQLKNLIFQIHNLSEHLGILVADSFQTKMGPEQKLLVANILNSHPNFAERVATQMGQATIGKKKERGLQQQERGIYSYEKESNGVAGFNINVNAKLHSREISGQTDLTKGKVTKQFDPSYAELLEYKRLMEKEIEMSPFT